MDIQTLKDLEQLNQLALTDEQEADFLAFLAAREDDLEKLDAFDTSDVVRMVHVMPLETVVREDVVIKDFTREELQAGAPETMDDYWQVPRVVE